jgi:hypothetical protein
MVFSGNSQILSDLSSLEASEKSPALAATGVTDDVGAMTMGYVPPHQ